MKQAPRAKLEAMAGAGESRPHLSLLGWPLVLHRPEQLPCPHIERFGQPDQHAQTRLPLPPLDAAEAAPLDARPLGDLSLREPPASPRNTKRSAKGFGHPDVALTRGHGRIITDQNASSRHGADTIAPFVA